MSDEDGATEDGSTGDGVTEDEPTRDDSSGEGSGSPGEPDDDGGVPDGREDGGVPDGRDDGRVPDDPEAVAAAIEADDHALDPADLVYPTLSFEAAPIDGAGGFEGSRDLDREAMADWLEALAGALRTHDLAVESPDGHVRLGIAPEGVDAGFEPGAGGDPGELTVSFRLRARPMFVADDPDATAVGARGGRGFVPVEQLTTDRERFRCYNWIEDPTDP